MTQKSTKKMINVTKDYRLFGRSHENRPLNIKKHRRLEQSMKEYGFLTCFPVVCFRDAKGKLIVKDGQHRLMIAETLGLPIYWVEESIDFDVAKINCSGEKWLIRDYAQKHSANGLSQYQEGIEFADSHGLAIGISFALLAGTTTFSNVQAAYIAGTFQIKDREWADSVAFIYGRMIQLSSSLRRNTFVEACMAVARVETFDPKRLLQNAERCREKLVAYSTREAFLDLLEDVYNFGRKQLVGLKAEAMMAMRDRNAASKPAKKS